jgi:hypothetical protein
MPTRKQRRRREKLKRHEWEEVYVDEEGRELDPDEVEQVAAARGSGKAPKEQERTSRRAVEPPSLRRVLRRGALFFPLMLLVIFFIGSDELTSAQKVTQAVVLMAFFLPFSYFMDTLMWRSYQKRIAKRAAGTGDAKRR